MLLQVLWRSLIAVFLVVALTLGVTSAAADSPIPSELAAIDQYIREEMQKARIPGLALGIVQDDRIVYLHGYGVADPSGRPVMPQTPFYVASVYKPFTALAIMQLVEMGKLELDQPVQRYLPWFQVADVNASPSITVRHLLTHTSGLPDKAAGESDANRNLEQMVRDLNDAPLTEPVGTTFQYCNDCYGVLELLVQTVSGQPFDEYVWEHIFNPLDMQNTAFAVPTVPADVATGYQWWFGIPRPTSRLAPSEMKSEHLISSAEDLSHFLIAQLNDGQYRDQQIVSSASIAEMHNPSVNLLPDQPRGLGWDILSYHGVTAYGHGGDDPGIAAQIVIIPERRTGFVLLFNANTVLWGTTRQAKLVAGVANLLLDRPVSTAGLSFNQIYLVINFIALGIVAIYIKDFVRAWRGTIRVRRTKPDGWLTRRVILPAVLDFVIAGALLIGVPMLTSVLMNRPVSLSDLRTFMPDLGWFLIVMALITILRGLTRLALAFAPTQESQARSSAPKTADA
jgi:CubicO group peptidase (beta-lactamase class C family)